MSTQPPDLKVAVSRLSTFIAGLTAAISLASSAVASDFIAFESGPVRPLAMSPAGDALYVANIPDGQLELFSLSANGLTRTGSVPVGLEPVAVAVAPDGRVWVVNHVSDSVSIVDVETQPPRVVHTLLVGDEPRDIVFGGDSGRAFITTAHRGQHRSHASLASVPGAGDPQLTTPSVPRADVWVFEPNALGTNEAVGGVPLRILSFFSDTPRALAVDQDGDTIYVAAFKSGNRTTSIPEAAVCNGFDPSTACTHYLNPATPLPGGSLGPAQNAAGDPAPETGIIVKHDGDAWRGPANNDWSAYVPFTLPDHDVFAFDANELSVESAIAYDHVGTTLFNMAIHPTNGKVYVSNTESPNHVRFEGAGNHGNSTVQGHLAESRISILSGGGSVDVRHLNKHLDYTRLHTDVPDEVDTGARAHSLATPLDIAFRSDGSEVFIAAYGSAKVGAFDPTSLEDNTFDPTLASANAIDTGGGPTGLVLDEARDRLYLLSRFDNAVNVVDLTARAVMQQVPLHNPEPPGVIAGRPLLYDAANFSANGEASCASCHIFAGMDDLAWNLGDPDANVSANTQPPNLPFLVQNVLHPMKGPMVTQTLKGISTHGALHWRGDRVDGSEGTDACDEPDGARCDERLSFLNFRAAFEGLVGMDGVPTAAQMDPFADFVLALFQPPNPVRGLDNGLTVAQAAARAQYDLAGTCQLVFEGGQSCNECHTLDPAAGFFGTSGETSLFPTSGAEALAEAPFHIKIPQLRNLYAKVGRFGRALEPDGSPGASSGPQVRGFGFLHDGSTSTLDDFFVGFAFDLTESDRARMVDLLLAFDSDLAPAVGQQVTVDATNVAVATPRVALLRARADSVYPSLRLGGAVPECDLVARGSIGGTDRGWLHVAGSTRYADDEGHTVEETELFSLAETEGPITFTCAPPGSGERLAHNRDRDLYRDSSDNCPNAANDAQLDFDGDGLGDACDPDADGDQLLDVYETDTGHYVSPFDTGTSPRSFDSDADAARDGLEVQRGSDPNDPTDVPAPSAPAVPLTGLVALAGAVSYAAKRQMRRSP